MRTELSSIGTPRAASCFIPFMMNWTNCLLLIITKMEPNLRQRDLIALSESMMSRPEHWSLTSREEVLESQDIVIGSFASSLTKKTLIWLLVVDGIITLRFGTSEFQTQSVQSTVLTFAETQSIYTTSSCWQVPTRTTSSSSFGTLVLVSLSMRTYHGMRDFHQRSHALSMEHSSKRPLVIWLWLEVVARTRSRSLMETICSSHVPRSKTSAELASVSTSVTRETCLHAEEVMESSEFSMLYKKFEKKRNHKQRL